MSNQVVNPRRKSDVSDNASEARVGQAKKDDGGFAERFVMAMDGKEDATIARNVGISKSVVGSYRRGSLPSGVTLFKLADELDVSARWLAMGTGPRRRGPEAPDSSADTVNLPRFDLSGFAVDYWPAPIDYVSLRVEWLARISRDTKSVWLADMPSDAMPGVAREGDTLICQNIEPPPIDGRTYVFLINGDVVIRRLHIRPEGILLRSDDPDVGSMVITREHTHVTPVARILGAIMLKAV